MAADKLKEIEEKIENEKAVRGLKGFFSEFWAFASKGNIFDLAIGIMIGGAFTAIVNSLVSDIITPVLSLATNKINFSDWTYTLRPPLLTNGATTTSAVVINYGHFLQIVENFVIVALCIFIFVKLFSRLRDRISRKEAEVEQATPATPVSTEEKLLCEIRDLLKEQVEHIRPDHQHPPAEVGSE